VLENAGTFDVTSGIFYPRVNEYGKSVGGGTIENGPFACYFPADLSDRGGPRRAGNRRRLQERLEQIVKLTRPR
jgi:hypothetical protein